jgi:hypothetical protein
MQSDLGWEGSKQHRKDADAMENETHTITVVNHSEGETALKLVGARCLELSSASVDGIHNIDTTAERCVGDKHDIYLNPADVKGITGFGSGGACKQETGLDVEAENALQAGDIVPAKQKSVR